MLNFGEQKEKVAILAQRSGDSDYLSKIGVWLNLGISFMEDSYDYWNALKDTYDFDTVDGQENYSMPNRFSIPLRVYDITNNVKLTSDTEEEYFDGNIAKIVDEDTGQPSKYRLYGEIGVLNQVSTDGKTLQVKSSSSSDTGSVVVRVRGYVDSNLLLEAYEDITISASSPTTYVAGTTTFYKITHVSKSGDTVGYITISDEDDSILEYLNPTDRVSRHTVMKLGDIPDDAYDMRVLFKKSAVKMVNDNDYPFTECDDFLILDAWGWALSQEKETVEYSASVWTKAKEALHSILRRENAKMGPDFVHKLDSVWTASHRR